MGNEGKIRRSRNFLLWLRVIAGFLGHLGSQVWNANGLDTHLSLAALSHLPLSLPHRFIIFYVEESFMYPFLLLISS